MNQHQFEQQMRRLDLRWPRTYGQEVMTLIWREVQAVDAPSFEAMVDRWIGELRQPPLLVEMREDLSRWRERKWNDEKKQAKESDWLNPRYDCDWCRDNGVYLCAKKGHMGIWAFRCHCRKGEQDGRKAITQYKQEHAAQGFYYDEMRMSDYKKPPLAVVHSDQPS